MQIHRDENLPRIRGIPRVLSSRGRSRESCKSVEKIFFWGGGGGRGIPRSSDVHRNKNKRPFSVTSTASIRKETGPPVLAIDCLGALTVAQEGRENTK